MTKKFPEIFKFEFRKTYLKFSKCSRIKKKIYAFIFKNSEPLKQVIIKIHVASISCGNH